MSGTKKMMSKDGKPGGYLKVVSHHDKDQADPSDEKANLREGSPNGEGEGDEPFADGDAFDDDDGKAEGGNTRERRKIEIKFIQNKARRHITFSKRKHGIMKKAWELSVLTGTQVLLLVVSETGLVYTFTTPKLQPLVTQSEGKNLIQACLNAPESPLEGGEDSPEPQGDSDGEASPPPQQHQQQPPSSAPQSGAPPDASQQQASVQAQVLAMRNAQAAQLQAAQEAQNRLASQQPPVTPPVMPAGSAPPGAPGADASPNSQAAAMRAAIQAQAQALAASGLPPHIQQFAAQGYKVPPTGYGYPGYPLSVGGQFGAQLANLGHLGGQYPSGTTPIDTPTLLAMQQQQQQQQQQHQQQQQEGIPTHNSEYPPAMPQQGPAPQVPPHAQQGRS